VKEAFAPDPTTPFLVGVGVGVSAVPPTSAGVGVESPPSGFAPSPSGFRPPQPARTTSRATPTTALARVIVVQSPRRAT
jgi:hypothetical protein